MTGEIENAIEKGPKLGRRLLLGWMAIAGRFGYCQTMMLLFFAYVLVIGPTGLAIALGRGDLLAKRGLRISGSAWQDADTAKPELERAKLLS